MHSRSTVLTNHIPQVYTQMAETFADATVELRVTYLEIYQNAAYDLLNAASGVNARLPKVSVIESRREGSKAETKVHNLSIHGAASLEDAQNLLYAGKTNRTVSGTTYNLIRSWGIIYEVQPLSTVSPL
jgi:kinesin family protein 6/9